MKFWDSSALLPLLVKETSTKRVKEYFEEDDGIAVWWGTETECLSALARRAREQSLTPSQQTEAEELLKEILSYVTEVNPSLEIKRIARRLLRTHPLRAADALQLAAAMALAGENISELTMITLDDRLRASAQQEGFKTLP